MIDTISDYVYDGSAVCERSVDLDIHKITYGIELKWHDKQTMCLTIKQIEYNGIVYGIDLLDKIEKLCSKYLDDSFTLSIIDGAIAFTKDLTIDECVGLERESTEPSDYKFMEDLRWKMEENTICAIIEEWESLCE